jgi:hypothetical protein
VLAVLVVTDEDDCSTDESELFMVLADQSDLQDPLFPGQRVNTRCTFFAGALYPIERYVGGLLALRDDPRDLVFGAIVGMPRREDLGAGPLLDDPRMQHVDRFDGGGDLLDVTEDVWIEPACIDCQADPDEVDFEDCADPEDDLFWAVPSRRLVAVAEALDEAGASALRSSVCERDLGPSLDAFFERVVEAAAP